MTLAIVEAQGLHMLEPIEGPGEAGGGILASKRPVTGQTPLVEQPSKYIIALKVS